MSERHTPGAPPATIEGLLGRVLPEGRIRDSVLGDLAEGYSSRHTRHGRRAARRWYRIQALRLLLRYGWERVAGSRLWERRMERQSGAARGQTTWDNDVNRNVNGNGGRSGLRLGIASRQPQHPDCDK